MVKKFYTSSLALRIVFLGFSSGIPFLLTLSTLGVWLKEAGASRTRLGFFALVTLPYALKFLWAPFIDHFSIPYIGDRLGKRRSWALISQLALGFSLIILGMSSPQNNLIMTAFMACCVSFFASIQDLVLEAYRIEISPKEFQGPLASLSYLGFRLGMMLSGAGALYISAIWGWFIAYSTMASCLGFGIITILMAPEPIYHKAQKDVAHHPFQFLRIFKMSILSFKKKHPWHFILAFILFYKVGDTTLNVMSTPFLLELGFSKIEIAHIVKGFGMIAMILGGALGGIIIMKFGILNSLKISAYCQILSSWMYLLQAFCGHNHYILMIVITIENFTCGLGASMLSAYLSKLPHFPYTATHYGLLTSFGSLMRITLSIISGWVADQTTWKIFFLGTSFFCIPSLVLLKIKGQYFKD